MVSTVDKQSNPLLFQQRRPELQYIQLRGQTVRVHFASCLFAFSFMAKVNAGANLGLFCRCPDRKKKKNSFQEFTCSGGRTKKNKSMYDWDNAVTKAKHTELQWAQIPKCNRQTVSLRWRRHMCFLSQQIPVTPRIQWLSYGSSNKRQSSQVNLTAGCGTTKSHPEQLSMKRYSFHGNLLRRWLSDTLFRYRLWENL